MRPFDPSTNQAIGSSSGKSSVILDRGVERGEIDHNLDRELVLDMILGSAIIISPDTCRNVATRFLNALCNHKI